MSDLPHCWRAEGNPYAEAANLLRGGTDPWEAANEWKKTACDLNAVYNVVVMPSGRNPQTTFDKVYMADVGWYSRKAKAFLLANPAAAHRVAEPDYVKRFFEKKLRLKVVGPTKNKWEGSSCLRFSPLRTFAVLGYGVRATRESCDEIAQYIDLPASKILRIKGKNPHIHLDTLFASLSSRQPLVVVCKSAFADADGDWNPDEAYERLLALIDDDKSPDGRKKTCLECVSSKDGVGYATNLREDPDGHVYVPNGLTEFYSKVLRQYNYRVHRLNLPRILVDGGGAAACLTNDLTEAVKDGWKPPKQYLFENVRNKLEERIERYPRKQLCWQ